MPLRRFSRAPSATFNTEVEEFLRSLNLVVGLDQLLDLLSAKLKDLSGARTVFVILYEPVTNRFAGVKAKGDRPDLLTGFRFAPSDKLVRWLTVNKRPLDVAREHEVVRFLSEWERTLLQNCEIAAVFPFIAVNRLTGAVFLTRRFDGSPYEQREIETVMLLANHSALGIEHALLYQFQEDKLKKILHADKLATVGELAAGAAHEIRNPLTSIRSTAQFLKKDLPGDRGTLVDGIIEEVDRIDHIIAGLLSFSKATSLKLAQVDLRETIRQTLLLLDPELRARGITVAGMPESGEAIVDGDAAQLKQLFLNILMNSIQAMPEGGAIYLSLVEESHAKDGADQPSVSVTVRDTGKGIPERDLARIFDPFFTTKEAGTGLGLSISYGIVNKHGGEILVSSSTDGPDRGTTMTVRLPRRIPSELRGA
ncbi:MAG: ATP-binding protein [Bacteroidota bacterium]